jgi:hypothetical protein
LQLFPFFLNPSKTAKQIRRIGKDGSSLEDLEELLKKLGEDEKAMPFSYFWEIWHRSEVALTECLEPVKRELLDQLMRSARFRAQSGARETGSRGF